MFKLTNRRVMYEPFRFCTSHYSRTLYVLSEYVEPVRSQWEIEGKVVDMKDCVGK